METSDESVTEYVSALDYAILHKRTKPWIVKLCQHGRIEGAYLAGGVWAIPKDAKLPEPMKRGPKINVDRALAALAMQAAKERRQAEDRERREADRQVIEGIGSALHPKSKAHIDHFFAKGGTFDQGGNCHIGDKWLMRPEGWNGTAWLYYQSLKAGAPVLSVSEAKPWPRTEDEAMRKYDIAEAVADGLTLDQVKASVDKWGADEQAYYDSLVSAL